MIIKKQFKIKNLFIVLLGMIFGFSATALAAGWVGTGWIGNDKVVSAPKLQSNLQYLYDKVSSLTDNTTFKNIKVTGDIKTTEKDTRGACKVDSRNTPDGICRGDRVMVAIKSSRRDRKGHVRLDYVICCEI